MTLAFDPLPVPDSPLARLDPRWKLAGIGLAVVVVATLRTSGPAAVALAASVALVGSARLPTRWILRRISVLVVGLLPLILILPFARGGGLDRTVLIVARATASVLLVLTLIGTAPLPATLHAAQSLRVPGLLVQLVLMSYRYVFVLGDGLGRLRRALRLRGFRMSVSRHGYRTAGQVVGTLLVRGSERADGVAIAMRCRGFDGRFRTLTSFRTTIGDIAFAATMLGSATALVVWDWWAAR